MIVNCHGQDLTEIPADLPLDTQILDLGYNKISDLNISRLSHLNLYQLYLTHNVLKTVSRENAEDQLPKSLSRIYLDDNFLQSDDIDSLFSNDTEDHNNIDRIFLATNNLSNLNFLRKPGFKKLDKLDLEKNNIVTIENPDNSTAAIDNPTLQNINLSDNLITFIDEHAINCPKLEYIDLSKNYQLAVVDNIFNFDASSKIENVVLDDTKVRYFSGLNIKNTQLKGIQIRSEELIQVDMTALIDSLLSNNWEAIGFSLAIGGPRLSEITLDARQPALPNVMEFIIEQGAPRLKVPINSILEHVPDVKFLRFSNVPQRTGKGSSEFNNFALKNFLTQKKSFKKPSL